MHITLKFIGKTKEKHISEIKSILNEISSQTEAFKLIIKGFGFFGTFPDIRVLCARIDNNPPLLYLHECIESRLQSLHIKNDYRPFNPHLSLGRPRQKLTTKDFPALVEEYQTSLFQEITVDNIIFYESFLEKTGARYIPLHQSTLKMDNT